MSGTRARVATAASAKPSASRDSPSRNAAAAALAEAGLVGDAGSSPPRPPPAPPAGRAHLSVDQGKTVSSAAPNSPFARRTERRAAGRLSSALAAARANGRGRRERRCDGRCGGFRDGLQEWTSARGGHGGRGRDGHRGRGSPRTVRTPEAWVSSCCGSNASNATGFGAAGVVPVAAQRAGRASPTRPAPTDTGYPRARSRTDSLGWIRRAVLPLPSARRTRAPQTASRCPCPGPQFRARAGPTAGSPDRIRGPRSTRSAAHRPRGEGGRR